MTPRKYASAMAFKQALERRLRDDTDSGVTWARKRQILVFDRFLARIFAELKETVILKGGLGLEMRLERARTTKDVDLRFTGNPDNILERLQSAARMNLEDFMTFEVELDSRHPTIQGDSVKYDGFRFRAKCLLAGKIYGHVFGIDIGVGDPIYGQPKTLLTSDTLAFAMIAPTEA